MRANLNLLLLVSVLALAVACGTQGAPVPPSLELVQPSTDLAVTRKGNTITLSWTVPTKTTDGANLRFKKLGPTLICRGINDFPMSRCVQVVGQVAPAPPLVRAKGEKAPPPLRGSFTETLPTDLQEMYPAGFATYALSPMNWRWRTPGLSNQVRIPLAPVPPAPKQVQAQVTAEGVVLSFTCSVPLPPTPELRYACRLYRREPETNATVLIQNVTANSPACSAGSPRELKCQVTDHSAEWESTYLYWVTPIVEITKNGQKIAEVEGSDSSPETVFTRDIFPPAVPSGVEAVASGVGQKPFVDLTWTPDSDADLAGYNVYRQGPGGTWEKANPQLVTTPAFRDENVKAGNTYTYVVTAVDVRGSESAHSEPVTEPVP